MDERSARHGLRFLTILVNALQEKRRSFYPVVNPLQILATSEINVQNVFNEVLQLRNDSDDLIFFLLVPDGFKENHRQEITETYEEFDQILLEHYGYERDFESQSTYILQFVELSEMEDTVEFMGLIWR